MRHSELKKRVRAYQDMCTIKNRINKKHEDTINELKIILALTEMRCDDLENKISVLKEFLREEIRSETL